MDSSSKKRIAVAAILTMLLLAVVAIYIKPAPVRLTASGHLQNGQSYVASCELIPKSPFLQFTAKTYLIRSVSFSVDGKTRAVPANALDDITIFNADHPLQVSEEGPVTALSIRAGKNGYLVQWRYLNGFFAQRRILNGSEVAIHNAEATLKAPTMVGNVSPDAPRRLGSSSLLAAPDEALGKPSKNEHE